jgi:PKD repeat protein
MKARYLLIILLLLVLAFPIGYADNSLVTTATVGGVTYDLRLIGPGLPPKDWNPAATTIDVKSQAAANTILDVPILNWSYGCSATSAAMLFGYRDRHGYPNMYTGPTNGGVFPSTNDAWGESTHFLGHGECPLSATHQGIDGRTAFGHVDDYWSSYDSIIDPYFGIRAEHADYPADCTGDFMGTSQYQNWYSNDGSTWFVWNNANAKTYDPADGNYGLPHIIRDGARGMKLFIESRGYTVQANGVYNQYIYGFNGINAGFTYNDYKAEIDAGNPVLIQLDGHTMLGIGYNDNTPGVNQVIIHDTWDHSAHTMIWGQPYGGMAHQGVTVFHLTPTANLPPVANPDGPYCGRTGAAITFNGAGSSDPDGTVTAYDWDWGDGTAHGSGVSPTHTYSASNYGLRTVQLRVQDDDGDWSPWVSTTADVNAQPVANPSGPYTPFALAPCIFNGGGSTDAYGGLPLQYQWDFDNDGTWDTGWLAATTASHTYPTPGSYTAALHVRDSFSCGAGSWTSAKVTTTVTVQNNPPHAEAGGPYSGNVGQLISFDGSGSSDSDGTIASYDWNWQDGTPHGTGVNPTHAFASSGIKTVILTVTDNNGGTGTDSATVDVNAPPHAEANGPYTGSINQVIAFSSAGSTDPDGSIVSFDWNWGDGTAHGTGASPTHPYTSAGTKTVTLQVTDNDGATGTDSASVTIRTPCEDINNLKAMVTGMTLTPTIRTALNTRLNKASTLCAKGPGQYPAIATLFKKDFIPYVNTKIGKGITPAQATTLLNQANLIIAACGG